MQVRVLPALFARLHHVRRKGRVARAGNPSCGGRCQFANLSYADLTGAIVRGGSFYHANLSYAILVNADFTGSSPTEVAT